MDRLIHDETFLSRVVAAIGQTRVPHIQLTTVNSHSHINAPYVMTRRGVVFGAPAVIDYLLNRVPDPPLVDGDPTSRGLQMTVFYALITREHQKLLVADINTVMHWLRDLSDAVRVSTFYVGDRFSIVDCAIMALLEQIAASHTINHCNVVGDYVRRCQQAIIAIKERNAGADNESED